MNVSGRFPEPLMVLAVGLGLEAMASRTGSSPTKATTISNDGKIRGVEEATGARPQKPSRLPTPDPQQNKSKTWDIGSKGSAGGGRRDQ